MMWIVVLALRRPYTFIVMSMLILLLGVFTIQRTSKDVFPTIDIPVCSVVYTYNGVSPDEMEKRISTICERAITTTVNDVEHIESQCLPGIAAIKVFFHPGARIEAGVAQLTSITQTLVRAMPPGITPPLIIQYNASSVPILQIGLSSKTLPEQQLYDLGLNTLRTQMATVQGASIPLPYGGKARTIMVDLDPYALRANGLSAMDVSNAVNAQNLILPAGNAKMGVREYAIRLNASTDAVQVLNDLPIKEVNNRMLYVRDVANVRDGFSVQQNIVNEDGRRAALLSVLKNGGASTLDVVERVKSRLPEIKLPSALEVETMFDQSIFVRAAVDGVVVEALIAACLTAFMILLFLGSWRSTLIVATSIPLSILTSIVVLGALHQTLNVMTLGGLALAVGILVDDATVEIENIHRNIGMGKSLQRAILDGAAQIASPTFVSTLAICIVFVSVVFLTGPARYLFTPMALAVVFAMLASYLLSRTVVPLMANLMLGGEVDRFREEHAHDLTPEQVGHAHEGDLSHSGEALRVASDLEQQPHVPLDGHPASAGKRVIPSEIAMSAREGRLERLLWAFHGRFNERFERMRASYVDSLDWALHHRRLVAGMFLAFFVASACLLPFVGRDFFPSVDAGQLRLHVRAPAGTRVEETDRIFHDVIGAIREVIPARELSRTMSNIGLPISGINYVLSDTATVGPNDGEILISLKPDHGSTEGYIRRLRKTLGARFPQLGFFFQPADIVNQILNFGLPAPIDIQVVGRDAGNYGVAREIAEKVGHVPGAVDVHIHQVVDQPEIHVDVDRSRAQDLGLTQRDVANNLLISLSSSGQAAPNYWLDPRSGVSYLVSVQTPQYKMNSVDALLNTSLAPAAGAGPRSQILANLATVRRDRAAAVISHYNVQPVYDIYANVQGRDLGGVASDVEAILRAYGKKMPPGNRLILRGQVQSMDSSFVGLGVGVLFAILLVYLLMVVNFQSWIDPFVIIMALPGALCGIIWILFVTQTTFSVPSLMGTIMCIGVATANSILMVTFANERRAHGDTAIASALAAGFTRLRPVLMTAAAMIIGMLPMAIGLGEGGEQNAPLGRAVIGGLLVATFTTLYLVPVVYSWMRRHHIPHSDHDDEVASWSEEHHRVPARTQAAAVATAASGG